MKIILLFICICSFSFAQDAGLTWAKKTGGTTADVGNSITTDSNGNIYTTGIFTGTVDFDPNAGVTNISSIGGNNVFIQKLDNAGNLLWVKTIEAYSVSKSLAIDNSGNVLITGYFALTADFDPSANTFNLTANGGVDIFVLKLNASGDFVWAKAMGGASNDSGNKICVDNLGNVYTTGDFRDAVDFDPSSGTFELVSYNGVSSGFADIFIQKLDAAGNFVWIKQIGGNNNDYAYGICADTTGNVYVTGFFIDTADFDPSANVYNLVSASNNWDVFALKLNTLGNFVWAKGIGGAVGDVGNDIKLDSLGNVYLTGFFARTVDFDPGAGVFELSSSVFTQDVFVLKLNNLGEFVWAKAFGNSSTDTSNGLSIDSNDNVYTTGTFSGTVDFDPNATVNNLSSNGDLDVFIQKLNSNGDFVFAKSFGGTLLDRGYSIFVDTNQNIFTTGSFQNTVDFDPNATTFNLTSDGNSDVFIHKMSPRALSNSEFNFNNTFQVYPNPTNSQINISFNEFESNATLEIYDTNGRLLQTETLKNLNNKINIENFQGGLYLFKISSEKGNSVTKIQKN